MGVTCSPQEKRHHDIVGTLGAEVRSGGTSPYAKTTLSNGVRVVTAPMSGVMSTSLICAFTVGSRVESDEESGAAHFVEHMLFKGTARRPDPLLIAAELEGVGGWSNASTGRESTSYSCRVPSSHTELAFDVLSDMIRNSSFDEGELEKERKVIIEEIRAVQDDPGSLVYRLIGQTVWEGDPLGRGIAGTEETVGAMTRDALVAFYKRNYTPERLVIAAGGDVRHEEIVALSERYFGDFTSSGTPDPTKAVTITQEAKRIALLTRETEQAHLCIGFPAISYQDERQYAHAMMIDWILSGGMSARLFQEIREKRGLVYSISSSFIAYRDTGWALVSAGTDPGRVDEAVEAIVAELKKLRDEPVTVEELERTKTMWKGSIQMGLESSFAVTSWVKDQEEDYGRLRTVEETIELVDAVTVEGIQELAKELIREERLNLALIGPYEDEEPFRRLLAL